MKLTGKSKAWISKRLKLSNSLHQEVQKMVSQREISIRMAEEIANLPLDVQVPFSVKVSANKFDDENVKLLVKKYLRNDTTELEREQIINNPSLLKLEKKITKNTRKGRGNEPPKPSPLKPSPQKPGTSQTSEKQKGKGKDDDKDNSKNNDLVNHLNYAQKVLKKLNELVVNVNHQEFIDNIDLVNKFINLCKDFEVRVKLKQK
jgi:hypothetical protein